MYSPPHMVLAEGVIGGVQLGELDARARPNGTVALADPAGSFDLGPFDVFDLIELPVRHRPIRPRPRSSRLHDRTRSTPSSRQSSGSTSTARRRGAPRACGA
jgi:hypothetical protein